MDNFFILPIVIIIFVFIVWINIILTFVKKAKTLKPLLQPLLESCKNGIAETVLEKKEALYKSRYKADDNKPIDETEQPDIKTCPRCGAKVGLFSKKCSECNYRLEN